LCKWQSACGENAGQEAFPRVESIQWFRLRVFSTSFG
jgi:hypothetical protein